MHLIAFREDPSTLMTRDRAARVVAWLLRALEKDPLLVTSIPAVFPEKKELRLMKEHYETMPECAKKQHDGYSWPTFEGFQKYHLCRALSF